MTVLVPLYGFVEGDTIGLLVLAHPEMTIAEVGRKLAESASVRVSIESWRVLAGSRVLDPRLTVSQAALVPMDRVDLRRR
jgi:hypothetical protein